MTFKKIPKLKRSDARTDTMKTNENIANLAVRPEILIEQKNKPRRLSNAVVLRFSVTSTALLLVLSSLVCCLELFNRTVGIELMPSNNPRIQLDLALKIFTFVFMALMALLISIYVLMKKSNNRIEKNIENSLILKKEKIQSTAFLESISHEIRTPLNGIIGYAEYIQHSSQESMIQFPAQIIFESSQHLLRLIDNLIDLTEIETRGKKVKKNAFSLNSSIDDLCKTHLSRTNKKNISLRYEYDPTCPPTVTLDESLFRKVITNLLDNAIVFSKDIGEIVLSVHYLKNIHSLYISIKDDGHGIPEKMHTHVFDKFWQIEDFIANAHGGSALGLVLTQKMVALMGGEINFNSAEHVGSIFYFTLPLKKNGIEQ